MAGQAIAGASKGAAPVIVLAANDSRTIANYRPGLVRALRRVPGGAAEGLGEVRGQPLGVLRVLSWVGERVVQLRVGQAALVQGRRERLERVRSARVLVQGRSHEPSLEHRDD